MTRAWCHRKLRRLVALDLKVDDRAAYKGQMERHLHWLDKFEREPDEAAPLGIIVCAGNEKSTAGIDGPAQWLTRDWANLPPRAVMAQRLQRAARRGAFADRATRNAIQAQ